MRYAPCLASHLVIQELLFGPIENAFPPHRFNQCLDRAGLRSNFERVAVVAPEVIDFADAGRVPATGDNVAIAIRKLPAGTRLLIRQLVFEFSHTVLEGHRFAIFRIRKGEPLLSWGLPFGLALRDIEPGEYLCNEKILRSLKERNMDFVLPAAPNFIDHRQPFSLDETSFIPGLQAKGSLPPATFQGYPRNERRGAVSYTHLTLPTTERV